MAHRILYQSHHTGFSTNHGPEDSPTITSQDFPPIIAHRILHQAHYMEFSTNHITQNSLPITPQNSPPITLRRILHQSHHTGFSTNHITQNSLPIIAHRIFYQSWLCKSITACEDKALIRLKLCYKALLNKLLSFFKVNFVLSWVMVEVCKAFLHQL